MASPAPATHLGKSEKQKDAGQTPVLDDRYISVTIQILDIPVHSNVAESEYSIELDHLTFPVGGTCSTDNLVRVSSEPESTPEDAQTHGPVTASLTKLRPDYKTYSLRWPFLVLILAFVGGIFGFLEYQVHDLPPLHYSMIHIDDPQPGQAKTATNQPSPPPRIRLDIASSTTYDPSARSTTWGLVRKAPSPSPAPAPRPRPPQEHYPDPASLVHRHCGWGPPEWLIRHWTVNGTGCSLASGTLSACETIYTGVIATIPTPITDDQSWCPCLIAPYGHLPDSWSMFLPVLGPRGADMLDSSDQGCKSAMLAVLSFNNNMLKTVQSTVMPYGETGSSQPSVTYTTPPTQFAISWPYPTTNPDGAIILPLVTRAAGKEEMDVFGHEVQPSDSALFPDGFQSIFGPQYLLNGRPNRPFNDCWFKWAGYTHYGECTETRTSYSIIWWTLPSGPDRSAESSTLSVITSSSTSSSASSTLPSTTDSPTPSDHSSSIQKLTWNHFSGEPEISILSLPTPTLSIGLATSHSTSNNTKEPTSAPVVHLLTTDHLSLETAPTAALATISRSGGKLNQDNTRKSTVTPVSSSTTVLDGSLGPTPIFAMPVQTDIASTRRVTRPGELNHALESTTARGLEELSGNIDSTRRNPNIKQLATLLSNTSSNGRATRAALSATTTTTLPSSGKGPKIGPKETGPILPEAQSYFYNLRSQADYLMASVLPVLLATLFSIPIQVFIGSLYRLYPLRALTQDRGAVAEDSLCLPLTGGNGPVSPLILSVRFLQRFRDPMPLLTVLLDTLCNILVPISSEVIRLETSTECNQNGMLDLIPPNQRLCAFGVRKSMGMIRLTEGILVTMTVITLALAFLAARWRSGVATELWSIATMASLLSSTRGNQLSTLLRALITESRTESKNKPLKNMEIHIAKALKGKRFRLGFFPEPNPTISALYGLEVITPPMEDKTPIKLSVRDPPTRKATYMNQYKFCHFLRVPKDLELCARLLALLFILGLLILVLHYETTIGTKTAFEAFMNSQTFGVRILFTAFGTLISSYWSYYFSYVSESQIHHRLLTANQTEGLPANTSILLSPPSNVFVGLWRAISMLKTPRSGHKSSSHNITIDTKADKSIDPNTNPTTHPVTEHRTANNLPTSGILPLASSSPSMTLLNSPSTISPSAPSSAPSDTPSNNQAPSISKSNNTAIDKLGESLSHSVNDQPTDSLNNLPRNTPTNTTAIIPPPNPSASPSSTPPNNPPSTHKPTPTTKKQPLLYLNISLATLLAKFIPILLSNIPFSSTVTWKIHESCTWLAVIVLSYMVLVLLASLALEYEDHSQICRTWLRRFSVWGKTPRNTSMETEKEKVMRTMMPVKVDTMAGYMYYLCDSKMTAEFGGDNGNGMLEMGHKKRDRLVCGNGKRYVMGEIVGAEGGNKRLGVDYCESRGQDRSTGV